MEKVIRKEKILIFIKKTQRICRKTNKKKIKKITEKHKILPCFPNME